MSLKKLLFGVAGMLVIAAMLFTLSQREIKGAPVKNQSGNKDYELPLHACQYSISLI